MGTITHVAQSGAPASAPANIPPEIARLLDDLRADQWSPEGSNAPPPPSESAAIALAAKGLPIVPFLRQAAVTDPSPAVRKGVLRALGRMRPTDDDTVDLEPVQLPPILVGLGDAEPEVRQAACDALRDMQWGRGRLAPALAERIIPFLLKALSDDWSEVRIAACYALDRFCWCAEDNGLLDKVASHLIRALQDEEANVRAAACTAMGQLARDLARSPLTSQVRSRRLVPALRLKLRDDQPAVQSPAIHALGSIGPASAEAVGDLTVLMDDREPSTAQAAAWALGGMGPAARPALKRVIAGMDSPEPPMKRMCLLAANRIDGENPDVLRATLRVAKEDDPELRSAIREAIRPRHIPALIEVYCELVLLAQDESRQLDLLNEIAHYGSQARDAVPTLLCLLKGPSATLRIGAADTLGRIRPLSPHVVDALKASSQSDPLSEVRQRCLSVLRDAKWEPW